MAKVINNMVLQGTSGMLGGQLVVRAQANGEYVLGKRPRRRKNATLSPAQEAHQDRFRTAAFYAKVAQNKPEYQALAAERHVSAFAIAVADFFHPPKILGIDVAGYTGAAGQIIRIKAVDDVKVASVRVLLAKDDNTVIEQGQAVIDPVNGDMWTYTATAAAPSPSVAIFVDATDLAGQVTTGTAHT